MTAALSSSESPSSLLRLDCGIPGFSTTVAVSSQSSSLPLGVIYLSHMILLMSREKQWHLAVFKEPQRKGGTLWFKNNKQVTTANAL